jgi:hypothetical protein
VSKRRLSFRRPRVFGLALGLGCALLAVAGIPAARAVGTIPNYHVWCGDWDANPIGGDKNANPPVPPASQVGGLSTGRLRDGSVALIQWGVSNGMEYVWARLIDGRVRDHIALVWQDNQNGATYQCGDAHNYSNATVWPNTTQTWTAGVPITPRFGSRDATAAHEYFVVWNDSGQVLDTSDHLSVRPWPLSSPGPLPPPPPPPPPPAPTPPTHPSCPAAPGKPHVLLHRPRRVVHNGKRARLRGRVASPLVSPGALVLFYGWVPGSLAHWQEIGHTHTRTCGYFSGSYRFTGVSGSHRYYLKAMIPTQVGFPFVAMASRRVRVRVVGPAA